MKIKYGILNTKNPCYDEDWTTKLQFLYEGSIAMQKNAQLFIPMEVTMGEGPVTYAQRLKCVAYRPYFSTIINEFISELFNKSFSILPAADASDESTMGDDIKDGYQDSFYKEFARNADLQGNNLTSIFECLTKRACVAKRAYLGVDFPKAEEAKSLADQIKSGLTRAYVYEIPTLCVIDWDTDRFGRYTRVVLKNEECPRKSITQARDTKIISFKVWEKAPGQDPEWFLFQKELSKDEILDQDTEFDLVDEGTVSFPEIPIMCMEMPDHLWLGGLIGNMAVEHFKRNSELTWSKKRNLFSAPVMFMGPELPGNGDLGDVQGDELRDVTAISKVKSKNIAVLGANDDFKFVEPDGNVYVIEDTSLEKLIDSMYALVGLKGHTIQQMSRMQGESGLAKMVDNNSKEKILASFANIIRNFGPKLYRLISEGRDENIMWRVVGMEDFKFVDSQDAVNESLALGKVPWDMSKTLLKHVENNLALKLAGDIPAETQATIKKEIDAHVDAMPKDESILPTKGQMMSAAQEDKNAKDSNKEKK